MAGADLVKITITGKGGHGAIPQEAMDPVSLRLQVLIGLQTIVVQKYLSTGFGRSEYYRISRRRCSQYHSLTSILQGSVRSFSKSTRDLVISRMQQISESIAAGMGCTADVTIVPLTPPVINSPAIADLVIETAAEKSCLDLKIDRIISGHGL